MIQSNSVSIISCSVCNHNIPVLHDIDSNRRFFVADIEDLTLDPNDSFGDTIDFYCMVYDNQSGSPVSDGDISYFDMDGALRFANLLNDLVG